MTTQGQGYPRCFPVNIAGSAHKHHSYVAFFVAVVLAIPLGGCQSPTPATHSPAYTETPYPESPPKTVEHNYQYPQTPPVVDARGLQDFLQGFRQKIIVVEFWSSWSRACREDLTILSDFYSELRDQGLRVVACTLDPKDHWATRTLPILHSTRANFPCLVIHQNARSDIREWLDPQWRYDLPARFILNRQGRVIVRSDSSTPITTIMAQARQLLDEDFSTVSMGHASSGLTILHTRLVNVATGEWELLPEVVAQSGQSDQMAHRVVSYLAARLDQSDSPRIAILPFPPSTDRVQAVPLGRTIAQEMTADLLQREFTGVLGPRDTEQMITQVGISAMAIDYDPSITRGRLGVDYLIIGQIIGQQDSPSDHEVVVTSSPENQRETNDIASLPPSQEIDP